MDRNDLLADMLIDGLSEGVPLTRLCATYGLRVRGIYEWRDADPEFDKRMTLARLRGVEAIQDQCLEIADDRSDPDHHSRKLRVWARLQVAERIKPAVQKIEATVRQTSVTMPTADMPATDAARIYQDFMRGEG